MLNYDSRKLEVLPGIESKPLFDTPEAEAEFRERWYDEVIPALEENDRRRARSELETRWKIVC